MISYLSVRESNKRFIGLLQGPINDLLDSFGVQNHGLFLYISCFSLGRKFTIISTYLLPLSRFMGTIKIRFKEEKGDQMFVKILTAMALDYRYSFFSKSIFSDSHNVNILNFLKYFCNMWFTTLLCRYNNVYFVIEAWFSQTFANSSMRFLEGSCGSNCATLYLSSINSWVTLSWEKYNANRF